MSVPPVLCYHRIGGALELGVTRVGQSVFTRQLTALAREGWQSLTLAQVADAVRGASAPAKSVLFTFDDGYASLADIAFPVLADLGFTAVTFLITDYLGRENTWDVRYTWRRLRHLDWPAIERWQARGFEFGSHTAGHRRLTWLSDAAAADELGRARTMLVARLGSASGVALAYPFGAKDDRIVRLARAAGHSLGFGGVRARGDDPLRLPRVPVYLWDRWSPPLALREGPAGALGRFAAHVANRCSVGTSWMLKLRD